MLFRRLSQHAFWTCPAHDGLRNNTACFQKRIGGAGFPVRGNLVALLCSRSQSNAVPDWHRIQHSAIPEAIVRVNVPTGQHPFPSYLSVKYA